MSIKWLMRHVSGAAMACAQNFYPLMTVSTMAMFASSPASAWAQAATVQFDIPSEPARQAVKDFQKQSGLNVVMPGDAADTINTSAVKGEFTPLEAIQQLFAGSNLQPVQISNETIALREGANKSGGSVAATASSGTTEVIVTGTHIRGANPTSPVHLITRTDIAQSGYSQVGDLMRSLPENFAGGQNPGILGASGSNIANQNLSNASTVNLRGLGSDATLVLLNGHRLSSDTAYQGADISSIPLSAVERVEVVPDGASAIYGSDAVAGVVNFVLKRNYNGAELSFRTGAATEGGGLENTIAALGGTANSERHFLVSFEGTDQNGIVAGQRGFTSAAPSDETLIEPQTKHSLFLSGGWTGISGLDLNFDTLLADRSANGLLQPQASSPKVFSTAYTPSYNVALTADYALASDWMVSASVTSSGSFNKIAERYLTSATTSFAEYRNSVDEGELSVSGTLVDLPSGPVKAAVGIGTRRERFTNVGQIDASRSVTYSYAEISAPILSESPDRLIVKEMEIDLSARSEHYSDFGDSFSPKVGLRVKPLTNLALRADFGRSFKAPSFLQMYQPSLLYVYPAAWLGYSGTGNALVTWGGNPDLKPERAKSSSFGFDYKPSYLPHGTLSATVFSIDYTDRVVQPVANLAAAFTDPTYSPFVNLSPTDGAKAAAIAGAQTVLNYGGTYDPANVVAIVEDSYQNASVQKVWGYDLSYRQPFYFGGNEADIFGNVSRLDLRQQTTVAAPPQKLSGTEFNPPSFKARAGGSWTENNITMTVIGNYISAEVDNSVSLARHIGSWETIDANLSWKPSTSSKIMAGIRVVLAVTNLFDRNPPHLAPTSLYTGLDFDSTNTSVLGRFVSVTVSKAW